MSTMQAGMGSHGTPPPPPPIMGPGARLKAAREDAGLSVDQVAQQLKLAPRQVRALEEEDFAQLPGRTFARGFGVRDAIIGAGLFRALENGDMDEIRRWLLFGAAADGADLVGTLASWRRLPPVRRTLVLAGILGFGGLGLWLSQQFA